MYLERAHPAFLTTLVVLVKKQNYVTMTKTIDDTKDKPISFLTLFGYGVKITPDINPIYGLIELF